MKKSNIAILLFLMALIFSLSSCLKGDLPNIDVKNPTGSIFELQYNPSGGTTIGSGLQYFASAALTYPPTDEADTTTFNVNLAGPNTAGKDITVTIGVDDKALLDNYDKDSIEYITMPDSLFHLVTTTATIKAGSRLAIFQIIFYPSKVDPTKNYNLPITITDAQGMSVSSNFGHIYFHTIGNPLAGVYSVEGTRYNYTGASGWSGAGAYPTPTGTANTGGFKLASPSSPTKISIAYANLGGSGYNYLITYDEAVPSIETSGDFLSAISQFKVHTQTISFNSSGKAIFHIVTTYNNQPDGSGNDRIIDETFTQQ